MPICSAALKRSPAWSRAPQATVGEPRAQDEGRLGEVAPTKLSGDARAGQRHSRKRARRSELQADARTPIHSEHRASATQAPLNRNSVLLGKTTMKVLKLLAVFAAGLALALAGCGSDDGSGGGGAGTTTNGTTTEDDGYSRY